MPVLQGVQVEGAGVSGHEGGAPTVTQYASEALQLPGGVSLVKVMFYCCNCACMSAHAHVLCWCDEGMHGFHGRVECSAALPLTS